MDGAIFIVALFAAQLIPFVYRFAAEHAFRKVDRAVSDQLVHGQRTLVVDLQAESLETGG